MQAASEETPLAYPAENSIVKEHRSRFSWPEYMRLRPHPALIDPGAKLTFNKFT
jgi:hypothetical protein